MVTSENLDVVIYSLDLTEIKNSRVIFVFLFAAECFCFSLTLEFTTTFFFIQFLLSFIVIEIRDSKNTVKTVEPAVQVPTV